MKKVFLLSATAILFASFTCAQNIGIGTTTPNASSILEIKSSNKGLLIPRTSTTSRTAIVNPAKGLMVYDTTTSGFWYHNGTAWTQIVTGSSGWSLNGNSNTDSLVDFIGTTNAEALVFKVNNQKSGLLSYGTSNTSFGYNAFSSNTTGNYNTATGTYALSVNTGGFNNVATGSYALATNTTGSFNVATGSDALHNNITGSSNTATGNQALYKNTTGSSNISNGVSASYNNTTGYGNVAIGDHTLYNNVTGYHLVAVGDSALFNNDGGPFGLGSENVAIGINALYSNTSGYVNTAVGDYALYLNTTGAFNTANGDRALYSNTTGTYNTANGNQALISNTTGAENTADGYDALSSNTTGSDNTALGSLADVLSGDLINATAIGAGAKVGASNTIQLGDGNVTSVSTNGVINADGYKCKPGTTGAFRGNTFNIDFTPGGAAQLWIDVTNLGTISLTSDRRLKEDIDLMKGNGIERTMELKPVHFKYKKIEGTLFSGSSKEQEGFIADELQQVIPSAVNGEKNALTSKGTIQPQTINIVPVVAVLTKAVQEQQQTIEEQNKKIDLQQQQINTLLTDMEQLKQKINTPIK